MSTQILLLVLECALTLAATSPKSLHWTPSVHSRSTGYGIPDVEQVSYELTNTSSSVEFTFNGTNFDGPKVHPVNSTDFDWWYFDALSFDVAKGDLSSVVFNFYIASPYGFETLTNTSTILTTEITGTFKNGTPFELDAYPAEAVIVTTGNATSGYWGDSSEWSSSPDLKYWNIYISDQTLGIEGNMTLESIAPPHLPCGPPKPGDTELLMPHYGWANAVPDSLATVSLNINGTALSFSGPGYHDRNWSDQPFFNSVASFFWGHGRLGPYSIIWFDLRSAVDGMEHFSSYVAKDGEIVSASCVNGSSVVVRPWGGEDAYPPPNVTANPDGFIATFANVEGKQLRVNVTNVVDSVALENVYDQWIGTIEGGFVGENECLWTGVALYEEYKM